MICKINLKFKEAMPPIATSTRLCLFYFHRIFYTRYILVGSWQLWCYKILFLSGIEDAENWHGKPLGAKAEEYLKSLANSIMNNKPAPQVTYPPSDNVAPVDTSPISLSEPPKYSLGEMVRRYKFSFFFFCSST